MPFFDIFASPRWSPLRMRTKVVSFSYFIKSFQTAVANRLRRRTSDQTVLGSNPAVAAALSPWTRLFTPIVPRRSLHISFYYPGQKNRYSREIHEVDRRSDLVISCDIELRFDSDATRGSCPSRTHVADRSRCRKISHDCTADQSHEYLGCNDFFGQGSISYLAILVKYILAKKKKLRLYDQRWLK